MTVRPSRTLADPVPVAKKHKPPKKEKKQRTLAEEIFSFCGLLILAAALGLLFQDYVAQPIRVDGSSMEATLHDGELLLVSKLYRWTGEKFQRGDVVICRYPNRVERSFALGASLSLTQHTIFVKRLVALPGDTVEIRSGTLYINGQPTPNPAHMGSTPRDYPLRTLAEDEYFVIGDNRFSSHDSRADDVGPIHENALMGKVTHVLWPLNHFRRVQ